MTVDILPIRERLSQINHSHKVLNSILKCIQNNVMHSRNNPLWESVPQWNTSRIAASNIEEVGLLARLGSEQAINCEDEILILIKYLMDSLKNKKFIKSLGIHYELFLSEVAIAIIYALEYFSPFLSVYQKKKLHDNLSSTADYLWDLAHEAPEFTTRTQSRLAWNHALFVHAVIGICAIKQSNEYSEERLNRAILWTEGYLSHSWTWDGFSREGIFYAGYSRMPLLLFIRALKEHRSINLLGHSSLVHHGQYLIDEWIPGTFNFISRNDLNHYRHSTTLSSLLLHAYLLECPKSLILWETIAGEQGDQSFGNPVVESNFNGSLVLSYLFYPTELVCQPIEKYIRAFKVYREAGVVVGFSKDSSFKYSFQASSHYSDIHSHADHGQVYLYLNGDILLSDAAAGNKNQPGSPDQSEGHNTLLINGKGMALAGAGRQSCSILEEAISYDDYHIVRANLAPAYNAYDSRTTLAYYKRLLIVHTKDPYYIIVLDFVSGIKKINNLFSYRFHTAPNNEIFNKEEDILITAKHSELKIIPFGIDWVLQDADNFKFNNETRSSYIDSIFYAEKFLGGYIMIPSNKKSTIAEKINNKIIIKSERNESHILFSLKKNDILSCYNFEIKNSKKNDKFLFVKDINFDPDDFFVN